MRHSFTKQCVTFGQCVTVGSALLLSLAGTEAFGQSSPEAGRPQQKALINLESNFISRWMAGEPAEKTAAAEKTASEKTAAASSTEATPAEASTRKALLPPNSILNRNYPPATSPAAATPLPPTTLVVGPAPISPLPGNLPIEQPGAMPLQQPTMLPGARPMAAPIGTTLPPGVAQAQLVAAQSPVVPGQAPVIIVVPAGWQPDGSVSFAPRTIMSPEVPAEHWPTVERNPFGDRSDRGMFTWPKFAKQIAGATLEGTESAAPQGPPSKALFAANQQSAPVQSQAKPLFAPAPAPAPVAAPRPESRALFAPKPAAPQATPADATAANASVAAIGKKSRALFNFGRKEDAAAPAAPVAVANAMPAPAAPQANVSVPVDPSEAPPEAPNLSDFESMPRAAVPTPKKQQDPKPAEKQTGVAKSSMKWRAKGSSASAAEVEPVQPTTATEKAEAVAPATQVVEQAAPASETEKTVMVQASAKETSPGQPTAALATPHAQPKAVLASATELPANQKALFASSHFSRGKSGLGHAKAPSRLAAPLPEPPAPKKPAEKAIVPNLLAMIPGLKDAGLPEPPVHSQGCVTPATAVECAATPRCEHVSHVSSDSSSANARTTQSYYAPAAEYPSEAAEETERPAIRHVAPTGKSNRRQPSMQVREEQADEQEADVEYVVAEEVEEVAEEPVVVRPRAHAATSNAVESKLDRQPRQNQSGHGTPSNGARSSEERTTKTYRRLTGNDVKAGLARPFQALNQFTKLPPTITRYASDSTNADLEEFEKDVRGNYAHGVADARADIRGNDDAVTRQPAIRRTEEASKRETAPSSGVIRSGRRRIVTPTVSAKQADADETETGDAAASDTNLRAEASDEAAEPEVKATRVRNKSGASVLIYSGADLERGPSAVQTSALETSSTRRDNPLR